MANAFTHLYILYRLLHTSSMFLRIKKSCNMRGISSYNDCIGSQVSSTGSKPSQRTNTSYPLVVVLISISSEMSYFSDASISYV